MIPPMSRTCEVTSALIDLALLEDIGKGVQSLPAGYAFPAGLVQGELREVLGDVDHTRLLVHDDHSA